MFIILKEHFLFVSEVVWTENRWKSRKIVWKSLEKKSFRAKCTKMMREFRLFLFCSRTLLKWSFILKLECVKSAITSAVLLFQLLWRSGTIRSEWEPKPCSKVSPDAPSRRLHALVFPQSPPVCCFGSPLPWRRAKPWSSSGSCEEEEPYRRWRWGSCFCLQETKNLGIFFKAVEF